ncbi:hypothetical protein FQA39_LY17512 [Lamprigera yunnana]|nr:hypothetical protein FQA39_LY17512 [Lamprigera yunnana]
MVRNGQPMNDGKRNRTDIGENNERQNPIKNKIVEEKTVKINKKNENKLDKIMSTYIQINGRTRNVKKRDIRAKQGRKLIGDNAIPAFRFYQSAQPRFPLEALSEAASVLNGDNSNIEDDVAETTSADIGDCDLLGSRG